MSTKKRDVKHITKELEAYQLLGDLGILAASLPQTAFLEIGLERIMKILGLDAGGIYIFQESAQEMKLEVSKGISSVIFKYFTTIPVKKNQPNILQEATFTKRPIIIHNIRTNPLTSEYKNIFKNSDFTGMLVIPIFWHNELYGAVIGFMRGRKDLSSYDNELFQQMSVPLAHALESSRLFTIASNEKRKLGTILHVMNDGVCTIDLDCNITFWNRAAEIITGLNAGKVMGQDSCVLFLDRIVDQKGRKLFDKDLCKEKMCHDAESQKLEGFFKHEHKEKKLFLRLRMSPLWQMHGKRSGSIIVFEDATWQWEVGRLKEDWRAMLTHDLKTPLTSTFGMLRILSESKNLDKRDKKLVDIGIQAYHQMLDLVNLYLDVEKLNAGRLVINPEPFELKALLKEGMERMAIQARLRHIKLKISLKRPCMVIADRALILRVLENLLSNAVKSIAQKGSITIKVEEHDDLRICASIIDDGIGIPQKDLPFLFDRFYHAGAQHYGKQSSTGLGLTFCKQVINAHDQEIWVKSKLQKGTTFCFTLSRAI